MGINIGRVRGLLLNRLVLLRTKSWLFFVLFWIKGRHGFGIGVEMMGRGGRYSGSMVYIVRYQMHLHWRWEEGFKRDLNLA
jgi:hypothetical protein